MLHRWSDNQVQGFDGEQIDDNPDDPEVPEPMDKAPVSDVGQRAESTNPEAAAPRYGSRLDEHGDNVHINDTGLPAYSDSVGTAKNVSISGMSL